jgi:hypothetical protein
MMKFGEETVTNWKQNGMNSQLSLYGTCSPLYNVIVVQVL